ncbi:GNAT family N-acetyltransferase [Noviherbaspirillum massiliense]|uniref:GNAT family N-acetyltransferase n=1 Tax=Noviherbaspirillum massiliense TaxID=1465823 RepID=UPI0011DDFDBE|nr:GNAT family N-acetyltransferase [Noviherbaspirillum massiliense]
MEAGTPSSAEEISDVWQLKNGRTVEIRTAWPDDAPLMQALVRNLSLRSRYHRFFYPVHEMTPDMLARFTRADPLDAVTLLAVIRENGKELAVGMAQYVAEPYPERGEFAVVVGDAWQHMGIASRLLRNLVCMAWEAGIERIEGDVLSENWAMRQLLESMDFMLGPHPDGTYLFKAWKELALPTWKCAALAAFGAQRGRTTQPAPGSRL